MNKMYKNQNVFWFTELIFGITLKPIKKSYWIFVERTRWCQLPNFPSHDYSTWLTWYCL